MFHMVLKDILRSRKPPPPTPVVEPATPPWAERVSRAVAGPEQLPLTTPQARLAQKTFVERTASYLAGSQHGESVAANGLYGISLGQLMNHLRFQAEDARDDGGLEEADELDCLREAISDARDRLDDITR
jgi:hypothetical protein